MMMFKVLVLFWAVSYSECFRLKFKAPESLPSIGRQSQSLLIDINSAETYLIYTGMSNSEFGEGFEPSDSPTFRDLKTKFEDKWDASIFGEGASFSGTYGEDVQDYKNGARQSFGIVYKYDKDPSIVFYNDTARSGVLGMNPWITGKTNMAQNPTKVLGLLAKCFVMEDIMTKPRVCHTPTIQGACFTKDQVKIDSTNIVIPTKSHPNNYWQIEADGYSFEKQLSFNQKFNIILSTTTLDLTIPETLFNIVNRIFSPTTTKNGLEFDCNKRALAKDISLKFAGQTVLIPGSIYADRVNDNCYLRLRPAKSNDWVLGLQFFYTHAVCLNGEKNTVTLNKSLYGEFA